MQPNDVPPDIWNAYVQAIHESELEEFEQIILAATAPAIEIGCVPSEEFREGPQPIFRTKAGGFPDLPVDVAWPEHEGGLLPFIAQVDLSELPKLPTYPLPSVGILYFFDWCTNETTALPYRVIYSPAQAHEITPRHVDEQRILPDWQGVRLYEEEPTGSVKITPTFSSSLAGELAEKAGMTNDRLQFEMDISESAAYCDLNFLYECILTGKTSIPFIGGWGQLFGYNSEHEALLDDFTPDSGGFIHEGHKLINLLEVISKNNMLWSDLGYLDFFIRPDRLAKLDFSDLTIVVASS